MSTSTLRPDSTSVLTGAIFGGAGSGHAALSDDSETTGVTLDPPAGATPGEAWRGGFGDLTLPAGAVIKSVTLRARASEAMVPSGGTLQGSLQSGTEILISGTVYVNDNQTWTLGSFTGIGVTDSMADAFLATLNSANGNALNVREAYVDVTYVEQPDVTVTGPTGTLTTTNLPTVEWTAVLDPDGGPQAGWAVYIYSDAQYTNPAFSPWTPAATGYVAASGTAATQGTATSWTVDTPLPDDTYRAYVLVQQAVNGQGHSGDWEYTEFTVDVDLPGTPTFAATADSSKGRIALALADNPGVAITDAFEVQRRISGETEWMPARTLDDDGIVAVPYVVAVSELASTTDVTAHVVPLPVPPGGILPGDLLIALAAMDGNPTFSWPSGWLELKDEAGNGNAVRVGVAWKRAIGGEQGTVTVTTSASEGGGVRILCVRGAHATDAPQVSTGVSSATADADPNFLAPSWGEENTLWVAAVGLDGDVAVTAAPTGYYEFGNTRWANASGAGIATATKLAFAMNENPGAFTHAAEDSRAFTLAVRPRSADLTVYDYEANNGTQVFYRARALHDYNSEYAASAWATDDETWSSTSWWLKHPNQPDLNTAVVVSSLPEITRAGRVGVFQPLGSSTALVVSDTRGPKTGEITFRALTAAAQDAFDDLLDTDATLLLQSPAGQGGLGYVRFLSHTRARIIDSADATRTWETMAFVVVDSPPAPVVEWPL